VDGAGVDIRVRGLGHSYPTAAGRIGVLSDVDLEVPGGGYCTLQGPSGAGKTTLLALIGGLDRLQEGSLQVGEFDLAGLDGDRLAAYRRSTVGFVFQHFGLLDALTAQENVELACALAGTKPNVRRGRARDLLGALDLTERATHRPPQLSGGERQRVAMARALVNEPKLLLADEPTGNLDEESAVRVVELLEAIQRDRGCTLVVVTHNRTLADRAPLRLRLERGRAVAA
jgi:putative ABC transport system ATP-binding protein